MGSAVHGLQNGSRFKTIAQPVDQQVTMTFCTYALLYPWARGFGAAAGRGFGQK
jgi:hypothetical protein